MKKTERRTNNCWAFHNLQFILAHLFVGTRDMELNLDVRLCLVLDEIKFITS